MNTLPDSADSGHDAADVADDVETSAKKLHISDKQLAEVYTAAGEWVDTIYSPQSAK